MGPGGTSGAQGDDRSLALLAGTLRREAHVLTREPHRLGSQVHNMLLLDHGAASEPLLGRAKAALDGRAWLRLANRPAVGRGRAALLRTLPYGARVRALAWSPDGHTLVSAGEDGTIRAWTMPAGTLVNTLDAQSGVVTGLALSGDGRALVSVSRDGDAALWDVTSWRQDPSFPLRTGVKCASWSPDSLTLACSMQDGTTWLLDPSRWEERHALVVPGEGQATESSGLQEYPLTNAMAWSPDGDLLATGGADNDTRLWHVRSGTLIARVENNGPVLAVGWSPDGRCLVWTGLDLIVHGLELAPDRESAEHHSYFALTGAGTSIAWSPDGKVVAAGANDDSLCVGNAAGERRILSAHTSGIEGVAWSPNGRLLASGSLDGTICIWDAALVAPDAADGPLADGHVIEVRSVAWSPDGRSLASGGMDSTLRLWDGSSGESISVRDRGNPVMALAWSRSRLGLACADFDLALVERYEPILGSNVSESSAGTVVHLLDPTGDADHPLSPRVPSRIFALAWSPDSRMLAAATEAGTLWSWDAESETPRAVIEHGSAPLRAVAWHPASTLVASGGDDAVVRIWRTSDGQPAGAIDGQPSGIHALAWSPAGDVLAVGCESRIRLYDMASMNLRVTLEGHAGPVTALAWLNSGRTLLSSGEDRTVRAWDVASGACVGAGAALSPVWALVLDATDSSVRAADNGAATVNRPIPYVFDLVEIER